MKRWFEKLIIKVSPKIYVYIYYVINFLIRPQYLYKNLRQLKLFKERRPELYKTSKKALVLYSLTNINTESFKTYINSYEKQNVNCIYRDTKKSIKTNEPILICAVKNDLHRVKMQLEFHRKLGIIHFIYIDNMSTDGTFEYLLKEGVDVFRVEDKYNAMARNSWIRQVTDLYGYNRWYLIMDSDELYVYPGMETKTLEEFIEFSEEHNMDYVQSFMIDMYSKEKINYVPKEDFNMNDYNIKLENCYFDTDTYYCENFLRGKKITGGPRTRVFSTEKDLFQPLLTKNPLIYLKKDRIFQVHHSVPYSYNFDKPIISGLLHYKFLPEDGKKYEKIVREGNYSGGSEEYKHYLKRIKEEPNLYFYYQGSQKFRTSTDLLKINIFDKELSKKFMSAR